MSTPAPLPTEKQPRFGRRGLLALMAVGLAAVLPHLGALRGAFALDDFGSVVDNATIRQLWPATWLTPPHEAGVGGRPVANLTFALDYAIGGLNPLPYHLTNLVLHLANALLLFAVLRRLLARLAVGGDGDSAGQATLLSAAIASCWAAHPLTTAAVGYVSQRTEVLMSLALLASLAAFIRHVERPRKRWAALCFISCALGMGAKEVMVVAPLAIWLLDGGLMARGFRAAWRQRSRLHLALASTWLIPGWLAWNSHLATRGIGFGQGIGLLDYIAVETQAVLHYLRLCVWPERLVFDHGWVRAPGFAGVPVEVGICLVLLGVTAVMLWRRAAAGLAAAWWWLLLAPTSSIIPIVQQPIAESRAYLASAGVVTLLVTLAVRWLRPATKPLLAGLVAVLLALGIRTHLRLSVYRSEIVLWEDTVARQPENARAQAQLGAALLRANRPQESAAASRAAVRLRPDFADALANLGAALLQTGEFVAASETLERTLHLSPEHLVARYNFGLARAKLGDAAGAIAAFRGVLKRQPQHAEAHINLAALLPNVGQPTEAEEHARSAVSLAPQSAEAHYNLGNALARRGDGASAMAAFETALRLQPTMAKAHNNLGVLLLRAGDRRAARRHFEDALRHQPDYPEARRNLAAVSRD